MIKTVGKMYYNIPDDLIGNILMIKSEDNGSLMQIAIAPDLIKKFVVPCHRDDLMAIVNRKDNDAIFAMEWIEYQEPIQNATGVDRFYNDVDALTKHEILYLSDIVWWLKGNVASRVEDDKNEFGQVHVDVLVKAIGILKKGAKV